MAPFARRGSKAPVTLTPVTLVVPDFSKLRVLVAGDAMLDEYWFGDTARISPEAPVPVVRTRSAEQRPGGAANVALNVAALGAQQRAWPPSSAHDERGDAADARCSSSAACAASSCARRRCRRSTSCACWRAASNCSASTRSNRSQACADEFGAAVRAARAAGATPSCCPITRKARCAASRSSIAMCRARRVSRCSSTRRARTSSAIAARTR